MFLIFLASFSFLVSIIYVFVAIYGSSKWWFDIPDRDMWYGYLGSWVGFQGGDWEALWAPHNEHILLISKILFFLDLGLFQGSQYFLHFLTFLVLFLVTATFLYILQNIWGATKKNFASDFSSLVILGTVVVAILWSWIQNENFVWAFQVQFMLAVLLPLWTFVTMALGVHQTKFFGFLGFYLLSLLLSMLSVFTMANGLLVPWLLFVMVVALRLRWPWALGPLVVGIATSLHYLRSGYQAQIGPEKVVSLSQGVLEVVRFFITYLSGPVATVLSSQRAGIISAFVFMILIAAASYTFFSQKKSPIYLALLIFVGFIALTGLVIAFGRVTFSTEYALQSRYQTPLLAGWTAVLLLFALDLKARVSHIRIGALVLVFSILFGFWWYQVEALKEPSSFINNKRLGALALALQVPDDEAISPVMPQIDFALDYGNRARLLGVTALGREPFLNMRRDLGLPFQGKFGECSVSSLEGPKDIYGDLGSLKASVQTSDSPLLDNETYLLLDDSNRTVGYTTTAGFDSGSSTRLLKGYWLSDVELAKIRVGLVGRNCS